ncbi:RNase adapter RapZ [Fusobacterium russii]|uniref:RNase adapter RapZ n=1 Tax=Fusobacterium russii TaxID=854 RepID=UPI00039E6470|nr:RNase adapter RapZ [Fusobacterium russii]
MDRKKIIIVTGLSGAGKTTALNILEDMGFYTIDNLPLGLEKSLFDINLKKIAVGIDIRTFKKIEDFFNFRDLMLKANLDLKIIFLEADESVILGRYNLSRRAHPLKEKTLLASIQREKKIIFPVKEIADLIIDTTDSRPINLEEKIKANINLEENCAKLNLHLQSFGYKYGVPIDSDLMFDVRFIPNPYYIDELKEKTGFDEEVKNYVMKHEESQEFYTRLQDFLKFLIPQYIKEGKKHLTISIGCSGGKHRSVTFINKLAEDLKKFSHLNVYISHREKEIGRW